MDAELQDRIDFSSGLLFQFPEGVQIPGIDDERFLADGIRSHPKGQTAMGIVQVVGGTDADVVNPSLIRAPPKLFQMSIEALDLRKKPDVKTVRIQNPH